MTDTLTAVEDRGEAMCVIGAGTSGLAGAHRLLEWGFPVDVLERTDDLGGNWNYGSPASRVFATTHLVSSKRLTQYPDYPMPASYPDFPSHRQAQRYLRAYADHFGLRERITFGVAVRRAEPDRDGWRVTLDDGTVRRYRGVVVANGHNWSPRRPHYPGHFSGELLHAAEYTTSEVLRGKRVVVVGGGNSGCDIACEAAQVGASAVHSLRRGYHFMPKYVFGMPADLFSEGFLRAGVPLGVRRAVGSALLKMFSHDIWRYGYPRPDHRLWESHLVLNSALLHHAAHGDLIPRPDIARFDGPRVIFTDGSKVVADVVVLATGYRTEIPFLGPGALGWQGDKPDLYLNLFSPRHDNLFVLGLMQPSQGQWQLVDHQARAVAAFLWAQRHRPARAAEFREETRGPSPHLGGRIRYVDSPRHAIELDHASYRRHLDQIIRRLAGRHRPASAAHPASRSTCPARVRVGTLST